MHAPNPKRWLLLLMAGMLAMSACGPDETGTGTNNEQNNTANNNPTEDMGGGENNTTSPTDDMGGNNDTDMEAPPMCDASDPMGDEDGDGITDKEYTYHWSGDGYMLSYELTVYEKGAWYYDALVDYTYDSDSYLVEVFGGFDWTGDGVSDYDVRITYTWSC